MDGARLSWNSMTKTSAQAIEYLSRALAGFEQLGFETVRKVAAQDLGNEPLGGLPGVLGGGEPFSGPTDDQAHDVLDGAQQLGGVVECSRVRFF